MQGLWEWLFGAAKSAQHAWGGWELNQAVEKAVEIVDPRIRGVSHYAKRLQRPVQHVLQYLDELTVRIPAGMRLSVRKFTDDPRQKVLFGNLHRLAALIAGCAQSSGLSSEPQFGMQGGKFVYVLLCMHKAEQSFLGAQLQGQILEREILQSALTFSDYQFLAPACSDTQARQGFKHCAYEGLLRQAWAIVIDNRLDYKSAIEERAALLRQHQAEQQQAQQGLTQTPGHAANLSALDDELKRVEARIKRLKTQVDSPAAHLEILKRVLEYPDEFLTLRQQTLSFNHLGILQTSQMAEEPIYHLEVAELEVPSAPKRVALVVSYPREETITATALTHQIGEY